MYDREKFLKALENKGYKARYFATGKEAADHVCSQVKGCTVGFGGSATIEELDLVDRLAENNTCFCPEMKYRPKELTFNEAALDTLRTDVFLLSVNGAAEDGTLVNIDGTGNRVGSSLFGHKKVYFIFSENKVMPTLDEAVELVLFAFNNAKQGDLFVQKAPAATIDTLARAIIELKGKVDLSDESLASKYAGGPAPMQKADLGREESDALAALVSLGYSESESSRAILAVDGHETMDSGTLLSMALKILYGK